MRFLLGRGCHMAAGTVGMLALLILFLFYGYWLVSAVVTANPAQFVTAIMTWPAGCILVGIGAGVIIWPLEYISQWLLQQF